MKKPRIPNDQLIVVILDETDTICEGHAPRARVVTITLTPEQLEQIELKQIGVIGEKIFYEKIASVYIKGENDEET